MWEPGRQAWALFKCDVRGGPQLPVPWVWTPEDSQQSQDDISGLSGCWALPSAVWWAVKLRGERWGDGRELNEALGWKDLWVDLEDLSGWSEHCEQRSQWLGVSGKGRWNLYQELGAFECENVIRDQILEALEILCEDVQNLFCKAVGSHLKF